MRNEKQSSAAARDAAGLWRADVFRRATRLLLVLSAPAFVIAIVGAHGPGPMLVRVMMLGVLTAIVLAAALARDPRRIRGLAVLMAVMVIAVCLFHVTRFGLTPGDAMGLAAAAVLVAVFLGMRAVLWVSGITAVVLVATGAAAAAGLLHVQDPRAVLDWTRMDVWLRLSTVYFAATASVAATVAMLIARLEHSVAAERHARAEADRARLRGEFLAEASRLLASSLDYEATLNGVARLAVPLLGDCCVVEVLGKDGSARRIVVGEERLVSELGLRSHISVPLAARDRSLGTLTFIRERGEALDAADVALADELGRRASMAVDSALLFEEAQEAIGVREEFLAIAAHELRTPCTSLQLALQAVTRWAKEGDLEKRARSIERMADIAGRQAVTLNELVEKLLDASNISSGSLPVVLSDVDLGEVARDVVARLDEPLRASGCALRLDVCEPVVGSWDHFLLDQVVTNLLSNAIKYGANGPIEISIRAEDDMAQLVVRDHGIGIPPEARARIFERFERAVPLRHYGGLGLGLYIVQRNVERMGGRVECASALGEGSTFTVTLPRKGPGAPRAESHAPKSAEPASPVPA